MTKSTKLTIEYFNGFERAEISWCGSYSYEFADGMLKVTKSRKTTSVPTDRIILMTEEVDD